MRFESGNSYGKGRPRGARTQLASRVLQDLLEVWEESMIEGKPLSRGKAALRIMSREKPSDFAKLYAAIMPREFLVENIVTDLADDEIDRMMEVLREQLRAQENRPAMSAAKSIQHAH